VKELRGDGNRVSCQQEVENNAIQEWHKLATQSAWGSTVSGSINESMR
jgi:hypothetical protein